MKDNQVYHTAEILDCSPSTALSFLENLETITQYLLNAAAIGTKYYLNDYLYLECCLIPEKEVFIRDGKGGSIRVYPEHRDIKLRTNLYMKNKEV